MHLPVIQPEVSYLSASQLKTFSMCPKRYFLSYVERVQADFKPVSSDLVSGQVKKKHFCLFFAYDIQIRLITHCYTVSCRKFRGQYI